MLATALSGKAAPANKADITFIKSLLPFWEI